MSDSSLLENVKNFPLFGSVFVCAEDKKLNKVMFSDVIVRNDSLNGCDVVGSRT